MCIRIKPVFDMQVRADGWRPEPAVAHSRPRPSSGHLPHQGYHELRQKSLDQTDIPVLWLPWPLEEKEHVCVRVFLGPELVADGPRIRRGPLGLHPTGRGDGQTGALLRQEVVSLHHREVKRDHSQSCGMERWEFLPPSLLHHVLIASGITRGNFSATFFSLCIPAPFISPFMVHS